MCPRVDPVEPPYDDGVAEDFEELMPEGMEPLAIFRTVANNPRVLRRMRRGGLLDRGSIEPREREVIILRTCANCGCEYEWGVHVTGFSRAVGLTDEQMRRLSTGTQATRRGTTTTVCWYGSPTNCTRRTASRTPSGQSWRRSGVRHSWWNW